MVNAVLVFGMLFSFCFTLNLIFIVFFYIAGDVRRGFKIWYMKKFKIKRRFFMFANIINASGNEYTTPVKVENGKFTLGGKKEEKSTYIINSSRCVIRFDGFLSGHWCEGNSVQIDYSGVYANKKGDAVVIDSIILRAKAASKFDELWTFLRGEQMRMYIQYAILAGLGVLCLLTLMVLNNVMAMSKAGVTSGVIAA